MMNKWLGIGRLGKDPELRYTNSGKAVCGFNVAVDGGGKDKTEWVSVVAWEKTAENCANYLKKGSTVGIEGRIQTRSWEDDKGNKHYKTEIVAGRVVFLDKKGGNSNNQQQSNSSFGGEEITFNEEDMPF